ncbi:hypothetical protein DKT74_14260 [Streptomyces sp. ZEA17I]|nr:hypothetical protein DKT74_14260 [Streptomyces sp. ZEA17I]
MYAQIGFILQEDVRLLARDAVDVIGENSASIFGEGEADLSPAFESASAVYAALSKRVREIYAGQSGRPS